MSEQGLKLTNKQQDLLNRGILSSSELEALRGWNPGFKRALRLVEEDYRDRYLKGLVTPKEPVDLYRQQGRVMAFEEILNDIDKLMEK